MKVNGTATLEAAVGDVWRALLDPDVLARTLPGCERLEQTGENQFEVTMTAGVGSIKGSFRGRVRLSDLEEHESLTLNAQAAGSTGTIGVEVRVALNDLGDDTTEINFDADAVVGGMIGGVGQRMLGSVSKRMAAQFFSNINRALAGGLPSAPRDSSAGSGSPEPSSPEPTSARTGVTGESGAATSPDGGISRGPEGGPGSHPGGASGGRELLTGAVAGASIALLGAVVGALASRRR